MLARIKVKGVNPRAERIAKSEISLAINALKLFFIKESTIMLYYYKMFDVDFNSFDQETVSFIYETTSTEFDFIKSFSGKTEGTPILINYETLDTLKKMRMSKLSDFITNESMNELKYYIFTGINKLGNAMSVRNIFDRIVNFISFYEGLVIPKESTQGKGLTLMKKFVLPKMGLDESEIESYNKVFLNFYNVRDKYLHNRIELPINLEYLYKFQAFNLYFIFKLIDLNDSIHTLEGLQNYFGIKM